MMPITINIFLIHTFLNPAGIILSLVLLFINLWILLENKSKYTSLFEDVKQ